MGRDIRTMGALRDPDEMVLQAELDRATHSVPQRPGLVQPLRDKLQDAMCDDVGVIRTAAGMTRGLTCLSDVRDELMQTGVAPETRAFNLTWHDRLNMARLCDISEVITKAALERGTSRGAHYREDFPEPGAMEQSYFTQAVQVGDDINFTRQDVDFSIVRPDGTILPFDAPVTLVGSQ